MGWYRKHFSLPAASAGQRVFIYFDGIMANSDVWINGTHLGKRPYGYVSFRYELTASLKRDDTQANVSAVRADNSAQPASRWYSGAGIYRHVRLVITNPVHIEHWGAFISTSKLDNRQASIKAATAVENQSTETREISVQMELLDPQGRSVGSAKTKAQSIAPGQSGNFAAEMIVRAPDRWDINHPVLYRAVTRVRSAGKIVDEETTPFGIRDAHFDPDTGFWLNGRNFKLKGVCLHGDLGGLGVAVPLEAWKHRLQALRKLGVNAIRAAHGPPAPEFLDLCDRMGFLVMDEMFDCWTVAKNPYDYHLYFNEWSVIDTRDTVQRDRNHPSIILYSAGNEIHDTPKQELAKQILHSLVDTFHANDPTRPVTQALFRPNVSHDYEDGLADILDVVGQNYRENEILAAHEAKPTRKIVGTENGHDRRVWLALRDNPPYAGQFIWAGVDYLGESRRWPVIASASGLLDRTDYPHTDALARESWWSDQPVVHMARRVRAAVATPTDPGYETTPIEQRQTGFADWTPGNLGPHTEQVEVYSNCEQVELILNGRSLGSQPLSGQAAPRVWQVNFETGTLKAIGKNQGQIVISEELRTASKSAKVLLSADKQTLGTDWNSVLYVTAMVADQDGIAVPRAADLIHFQISGPGTIAAVDNDDIASHEPFQNTERRACGGRAIAVVKAAGAPGPIQVSASADGLAGTSVSINSSLTAKPSR